MKAADRYKLWDICLLILKASHSQEPLLVQKLWRSIVYRQIPDFSQYVEGSAFLESKRNPVHVFLDRR